MPPIIKNDKMDSRFKINVNFSIYGKGYSWEGSLNWSANPGEIDRRINEFFLDAHADAYRAWLEESEQPAGDCFGKRA